MSHILKRTSVPQSIAVLVVSLAALTIVFMIGCSDDRPSAQPPFAQPSSAPIATPTPESTMAPSPEPPSSAEREGNTSTPEPTQRAVLPTAATAVKPAVDASSQPETEEARPSGDFRQRLSADSTWQDAFETFSDSEQACIQDALGEIQLESVLQRGLLEESGAGAPWEVSIYRCLEPSVAHNLMSSIVSIVFRQSGIEVNYETEGCWTEAISTFDVVEIVAGDPTVEEEFAKQIRLCLESLADPHPLTFERGLVDLLRLIPLSPDTRSSVILNDYKRAREAHHIMAPQDDPTAEDLKRYRSALWETGMAPGPWISGFAYQTEPADQLKHLGFDLGDVEQTILAGEPPFHLEAAMGDFDAEVTDRVLAACAECPVPEIREYMGIEFYSWGEDYQPNKDMRLQPPAFDHLGRGGRIAVLDSLVFRTVGTVDMWSLIETNRGIPDSLADDPDFVLAATVLDRLGVYSAMLVGDVEDLVPVDICVVLGDCEVLQQLRSLLGSASDESDPDKYVLLGIGVANDEDGFYTVLVFVYEDGGVATRNVEKFEEALATGYSVRDSTPWTQIFSQSDVWTEGKALIAMLRTEHPGIWMEIVHAQESILWPK